LSSTCYRRKMKDIAENIFSGSLCAIGAIFRHHRHLLPACLRRAIGWVEASCADTHRVALTGLGQSSRFSCRAPAWICLSACEKTMGIASLHPSYIAIHPTC
jgi:hypothetical protein